MRLCFCFVPFFLWELPARPAVRRRGVSSPSVESKLGSPSCLPWRRSRRKTQTGIPSTARERYEKKRKRRTNKSKNIEQLIGQMPSETGKGKGPSRPNLRSPSQIGYSINSNLWRARYRLLLHSARNAHRIPVSNRTERTAAKQERRARVASWNRFLLPTLAP